jgi:mRNA degradation ribonuclease J1/J2
VAGCSQIFDRSAFESVNKDGVTLMMSDSTNVLSPGRTTSERMVEENLIRCVQGHSGRIIATQFASNLHRIHSMKVRPQQAGLGLAHTGMRDLPVALRSP